MNPPANEAATTGASAACLAQCPPRMEVKTLAANNSSGVAPLASVVCAPSSQPAHQPQSIAFNRLLQPAVTAPAVSAYFSGISSSQLSGLGPVKDAHKALFITTSPSRLSSLAMLSP
jgi:hypothetical protein